jgi:hypothetical protein
LGLETTEGGKYLGRGCLRGMHAPSPTPLSSWHFPRPVFCQPARPQHKTHKSITARHNYQCTHAPLGLRRQLALPCRRRGRSVNPFREPDGDDAGSAPVLPIALRRLPSHRVVDQDEEEEEEEDEGARVTPPQHFFFTNVGAGLLKPI